MRIEGGGGIEEKEREEEEEDMGVAEREKRRRAKINRSEKWLQCHRRRRLFSLALARLETAAANVRRGGAERGGVGP